MTWRSSATSWGACPIGDRRTRRSTRATRVAVERTINFKNRSSSLLDSFIEEIDIDGDTPEDIARSVALFTERGENGRHPRWMHDRFVLFRKQGIHLQPDQWGEDFTNQTGLNVNRAVNGIARLLSLLSEN